MSAKGGQPCAALPGHQTGMHNRLFCGHYAQTKAVAGAQLGKSVKIGVQHRGDFWVSARGLVIGQEYGCDPITRHLNRTSGHRL